MPSDAMVCLITFGAMCMLHEIADASEYNKVHVFHGSRDISSSSVCLLFPLLSPLVVSFDTKFKILADRVVNT